MRFYIRDYLLYANNKMLKLLLMNFAKTSCLDEKLSELLNEGVVFINDCFMLKKIYNQQKHYDLFDFTDKTQYECFINSFHLDDYIDDDFLTQALIFSDSVIDLWKETKINNKLNIVLSQTDFGINLKFYIVRANENWINPIEIESFEEAILLCSS